MRPRVGVVEDEAPDHVVGDEELVDAEAPGEALVVAAVAAARRGRRSGSSGLAPADRLVRRAVRDVARRKHALVAPARALGVDAELLELVRRRLVRLLAVRAEHAHEPLREDADDGRAHEERLDVHLDQARDGAGGVVRVDRREHEVARHRGVDGDLRRLLVADLADHDHVRDPDARRRAARSRT